MNVSIHIVRAAFLLVVLAPGSARPAPREDPAPASIPAAYRSLGSEDLTGDSLSPRGEAFTMALPGTGWIWMVERAQAMPAPSGAPRIYHAFHPATKEIESVIVFPDPGGKSVDRLFMRGMEQGSPRRDTAARRTQAFSFSEVQQPVAGFRYTYRVEYTDGRIFHYVGYATGADPKYFFRSMSMREGERPTLSHWIATFHAR